MACALARLETEERTACLREAQVARRIKRARREFLPFLPSFLPLARVVTRERRDFYAWPLLALRWRVGRFSGTGGRCWRRGLRRQSGTQGSGTQLGAQPIGRSIGRSIGAEIGAEIGATDGVQKMDGTGPAPIPAIRTRKRTASRCDAERCSLFTKQNDRAGGRLHVRPQCEAAPVPGKPGASTVPARLNPES